MRLSDEGNETVTNCNALKFPAADGRPQHRIEKKVLKTHK